MKKQMKKEKIAVLVTTEHRGVFFGYIDEGTEKEDPITLYDKRMCTYWSEPMKGVFGLAAYGPDKDCRIGEKVSRAILKNITSVVECSPEAVKNWEKAPWG